MKVTMAQLYELQSSINTGRALKADIYSSDDDNASGRIVAEARDIHGNERVLVVWIDGWFTHPEDYPEHELDESSVLEKIAASTIH